MRKYCRQVCWTRASHTQLYSKLVKIILPLFFKVTIKDSSILESKEFCWNWAINLKKIRRQFKFRIFLDSTTYEVSLQSKLKRLNCSRYVSFWIPDEFLLDSPLPFLVFLFSSFCFPVPPSPLSLSVLLFCKRINKWIQWHESAIQYISQTKSWYTNNSIFTS